ncbi:MAG: hypothetical protein ACFCVD_03015 [Nodosilinea sp.]
MLRCQDRVRLREDLEHRGHGHWGHRESQNQGLFRQDWVRHPADWNRLVYRAAY